MKSKFVLLCTMLFTSCTLFANEPAALQSKEVDFFNQQNNRPVKIKFWYQGDTKPCDAKICLSASQSPKRVAVISHGAFGSPREMNWLGYALAAQGWVVAGVAHYGESWVYGAEKIDPSSVMRFWQRPQDISFAISSLSSEGLFNIELENKQVLMLGHSSGGFTSLAMAGATLDLAQSKNYCLSDKAKHDKGCDYGKQAQKPTYTKKMLHNIDNFQRQMHDERIAAVVALDPALGHAAKQKSLAQVKIPTLIVGSVENDFLPYEFHAKYYAEHIERATLVGIEQGAGHFIYLDECKRATKVKGVALCIDRPGVERKVIQQQILKQIFTFINRQSLS